VLVRSNTNAIVLATFIPGWYANASLNFVAESPTNREL
jgi:hypothetical protein